MDSATEITTQIASVSIPDIETLAAYVIDCDLQLARDLLVVISRGFAFGDSTTRHAVASATKLIARAVASEVVRDDDALAPHLPPLGIAVPAGTTAMRRIGIAARDVPQVWANRPSAIFAAFPLAVAVEVVPGPVWSYLACFVAGGPAEAGQRLHEAIKQRAKTCTVASLHVEIASTWLMMRLLQEFASEVGVGNELRKRDGRALLPVSPCIEQWSSLPPKPSEAALIKLGASSKKRDTSAVPLADVRVMLKRLAGEAGWFEGATGDWECGKNWKALKRLVVAVLLVVVAPRIDHLRMLDVDDIVWHSFGDGEEAWGVRFRGVDMKMRDGRDVYVKKIPPEVAAILHAWIRCSGRELGQKGAPLLISRIARPGEAGRRYEYGSLGSLVAGNASKTRPEGANRPLVPLPGSEWKGYQSHRFRSFVTQHAEALVHDWRLKNPTHPLSGTEPKVFAELLLDHGTGDMGYRDLDYQPRYERFVALAIGLIWESVWGEGAKRKGTDLARLAEARARYEMVQAQIPIVQESIRQREQEKDQIKAEKAALIARARTARGEARDDLRFDVDILQDRSDDLNDEITRALRAQIELTNSLDDAKREFDDAKHAEIVLPGDLPEAVYQQQRAVALGEAEDITVEWIRPMADELIPHDLAELLDLTTQTIWRYRTGRGHLPNPRPFDIGDWIKYGAKDHRLPVDAINLAAIPAADPEAALAAVRRKRAVLGFPKSTTQLAA